MFSTQRSLVCCICSYLLRRHKRTTEDVHDVVKWDIGRDIVKQPRGVDSVHLRHTQLKPAENMQTL